MQTQRNNLFLERCVNQLTANSLKGITQMKQLFLVRRTLIIAIYFRNIHTLLIIIIITVWFPFQSFLFDL